MCGGGLRGGGFFALRFLPIIAGAVIFGATTAKVISGPDCATDQHKIEREQGEQDDAENQFTERDAVGLVVDFELHGCVVTAVLFPVAVLLPLIFPFVLPLALPAFFPVALQFGLPLGLPLFALGFERGRFGFVGLWGGVLFGVHVGFSYPVDECVCWYVAIYAVLRHRLHNGFPTPKNWGAVGRIPISAIIRAYVMSYPFCVFYE